LLPPGIDSPHRPDDLEVIDFLEIHAKQTRQRPMP
jgi:hypothetical protein